MSSLSIAIDGRKLAGSSFKSERGRRGASYGSSGTDHADLLEISGSHSTALEAATIALQPRSDEQASLPEEQASLLDMASWCLMGISSWWALNCISSELPIFTSKLPERKSISNIIAVCTQVGNVFPIVYKLVFRKGGPITATIVVAQVIAIGALVLTGLGWGASVGGHSVVLIVGAILAGGVGCISNVTYWAAAMSYPASCTRAMSVGMTFGGLITNVMAATQIAGSGEGEPRYSVFVFMAISAVLQGLQFLAFLVQMRQNSKKQLQEEAVDENDEAEFTQPPPPAAVEIPAIGRMYLVFNFVLYAATYTIPTLQPYMISAYSDAEYKQLYMQIQFAQNAGDVLGRLATACVSANPGVLIVWTVVLVATFGMMLLLVFLPDLITDTISAEVHVASAVTITITAFYYFARGLLVTSLYLRARKMPDAISKYLGVNMGFYGQMGAMGANLVTFILVNVVFAK